MAPARETPGKSRVAGWWNGDSRARIPGLRETTTGPLPQFESLFRISSLGTLLPRYAPLVAGPRVLTGWSLSASPSLSPRHTRAHQRAGRPDAAREHTRTRRPPSDVNKPRTPGRGRPSRECSHRVTYVHTLPPRASWMDADASRPPQPLPAGLRRLAAGAPSTPAPQHPAKLPSAPTWSLDHDPSSRQPTGGGDTEHQQRRPWRPAPGTVSGCGNPAASEPRAPVPAPDPRSSPLLGPASPGAPGTRGSRCRPSCCPSPLPGASPLRS